MKLKSLVMVPVLHRLQENLGLPDFLNMVFLQKGKQGDYQ